MALSEKLNKIPIKFRKIIVIFIFFIVFIILSLLAFVYLYLTSRLSYPERNVIYRVNESVTEYSSNKYHKERYSVASISEGGLTAKNTLNLQNDVLVKAIMCTSKRREKGDVDEYELLNTTYQKIAQASTKSERSRAVFDISKTNYIQNVIGFVNPMSATEEIKLVVLEKAPEIAMAVDADTYVINDEQKPILKYRLTDKRRYFGILGDKFRYSTKLSYNLNNNFKLVYHSVETGLFGFLPQSSKLYLFNEVPSFFETIFKYFSKNDTNEIIYSFNIKQIWDIFPWRTLNGGYIIYDKVGELAKIYIQDFWFHYGDDCVYWYYLDLDGNGVIDETKEVIGKVLFSKIDPIKSANEDDKTYTINYSFMAGYNVNNALNDFILCGDIEALMPDQIFDGFGQHSYLGLIEEKRDDIMLYLDKNIENLDRVIKEDDTLGFKTSLLRLLLYAKRSYLSDISNKLNDIIK